MGETNIFKVLADSQRRDILIMLRNERLNAGEIAEKWSQPFSKITLTDEKASLEYLNKASNVYKDADLIFTGEVNSS